MLTKCLESNENLWHNKALDFNKILEIMIKENWHIVYWYMCYKVLYNQCYEVSIDCYITMD